MEQENTVPASLPSTPSLHAALLPATTPPSHARWYVPPLYCSTRGTCVNMPSAKARKGKEGWLKSWGRAWAWGGGLRETYGWVGEGVGVADGGRDIQTRGWSRGVTDVLAETTEKLDDTFPLIRPGEALPCCSNSIDRPVYRSLLFLSSVIFHLSREDMLCLCISRHHMWSDDRREKKNITCRAVHRKLTPWWGFILSLQKTLRS